MPNYQTNSLKNNTLYRSRRIWLAFVYDWKEEASFTDYNGNMLMVG